MPRILVVDKNAENVKFLEQLLKKLPETSVIMSFTNSLKAITWAQKNTFDVGLIDNLDVIRKIRKTNTNAECGLILMTTEDERGILAAAFEAGASEYIAQPFEASVFYARVQNLLTIQQQKKDLARYSYSTLHDTLTGLPNRSLFVERVNQAFLRFKRNPEEKFAVLFADVDKFKEVNDTFGHASGDEMLREVALLLMRCTREVDTVARLGGDEFIILLEFTSTQEDVERYITRVYKEAKQPIQISNSFRKVELSLGVTLSHERQKDLGDILREADIALYQAKKKGRNRAEFYTEKMEGFQKSR